MALTAEQADDLRTRLGSPDRDVARNAVLDVVRHVRACEQGSAHPVDLAVADLFTLLGQLMRDPGAPVSACLIRACLALVHADQQQARPGDAGGSTATP